MNLIRSLSVLIILWAVVGCMNRECNNDAAFSGMWRLHKIESATEGDGGWMYDSAFDGWNGYILYDGHGYMGVQITPKGYREFDTGRNTDSLDTEGLKELVSFYKSNFVYFANYKISGGTIAHKRLSATNPEDWGSTLVRDFTFRGDTLILAAHEKVWGKNIRLWWIRLKNE
jgi:hypothetical protein